MSMICAPCCGPGTRRFRSDVDDLRTFGHELEHTCVRRRIVEIQSTVGKRVRRAIANPHDERAPSFRDQRTKQRRHWLWVASFEPSGN